MRISRPVGDFYREALLAAAPSLCTVIPCSADFTRSFYQSYKDQDAKAPCFGAGREGGCRQWWRRLVYDTFVTAGLPESVVEDDSFENAFETLYGDYFGGSNAWELLPTTAPALASIRQWCDRNGCCLGVVSNMDDRLPGVLESLGIRRNFDFVLTSYAHGAEKPSPTIFAEARRIAGIDENAPALHCGDSAKRDLIGAQRSGFRAVLLDADSDSLQPLSTPLAKDSPVPPSAFCAPHIGHILSLLDGSL